MAGLHTLVGLTCTSSGSSLDSSGSDSCSLLISNTISSSGSCRFITYASSGDVLSWSCCSSCSSYALMCSFSCSVWLILVGLDSK